MTETNCPSCLVEPDQKHEIGCDVARCNSCEGQFITCDCPNGTPDTWSGVWPGVAEAAARGWFARFIPNEGWVMCGPDDEGAQPDLNRLAVFNISGEDPYANHA